MEGTKFLNTWLREGLKAFSPQFSGLETPVLLLSVT